jgi:hypothetical protein
MKKLLGFLFPAKNYTGASRTLGEIPGREALKKSQIEEKSTVYIAPGARSREQNDSGATCFSRGRRDL